MKFAIFTLNPNDESNTNELLELIKNSTAVILHAPRSTIKEFAKKLPNNIKHSAHFEPSSIPIDFDYYYLEKNIQEIHLQELLRQLVSYYKKHNL